MPTSPKLAEAKRKIRSGKVVANAKAEYIGTANGQQRITREIGIYLYGIAQGGKKYSKTGEGVRLTVHRVYKQPKPVGHSNLQKHAPHHEFTPLSHQASINRSSHLLNLRHQVGISTYRP